MQGVKQVYGSCDGRRQETNFFFFSRQRKQVAGNWKRRGHVRPQWTVWNSLKLSCCLSLDHLGFWEAEATLGSLGNSFHQRRRHWRGRDDLWSLNFGKCFCFLLFTLMTSFTQWGSSLLGDWCLLSIWVCLATTKGGPRLYCAHWVVN